MFLLKRLPVPLHRALYRLAHGMRVQVWKFRGPMLQGVRVLALDSAGRVLLVRHSYGSGTWMPPSGGLRRGEDPTKAAARELAEETGCLLAASRLAVVLDEELHGARNRVHVVTGTTSDSPRADGREITEADFFALDALPQPMSMQLVDHLRAWAAIGD